MSPREAAETPLVEQLRSVPKDARQILCDTSKDFAESRNIPYGRMCHEAADQIEALRAALAEAPKAEPVAWTPVTTRHPPWDERKVVCYTEAYVDYGGAQFITMPASDFHCYDEEDSDEPGSRESKTVSHWIYEDDLIRAVLAQGSKG